MKTNEFLMRVRNRPSNEYNFFSRWLENYEYKLYCFFFFFWCRYETIMLPNFSFGYCVNIVQSLFQFDWRDKHIHQETFRRVKTQWLIEFSDKTICRPWEKNSAASRLNGQGLKPFFHFLPIDFVRRWRTANFLVVSKTSKRVLPTTHRKLYPSLDDRMLMTRLLTYEKH